MIIILLLMTLQLPLTPYIGVDGNFYANYTGQCTESEPSVVFINAADSLDVDSLLELYPCVSILDSLAFTSFVESRI